MEKMLSMITLRSSSQVNDYDATQSHPLPCFSSQVLAVRDKLPDLRAIVQYGEEEVEHDGVVSWEEFQVGNDGSGDDDDNNSKFTMTKPKEQQAMGRFEAAVFLSNKIERNSILCVNQALGRSLGEEELRLRLEEQVFFLLLSTSFHFYFIHVQCTG